MTTAAVVTASGLLLDGQGRVLLGLRSARKTAWPNFWDAIGGKLEAGETADEALAREMFEEIGVRVTAFHFLETLLEQRPDLNGHAVHHIYVVTGWDGEPANLSDEHVEIKWFDSEALTSLSNLADQDYFRLIRKAKP